MLIKFYQKINLIISMLILFSMQTAGAWHFFSSNKPTTSVIKREFLFSPYGTISIENENLQETAQIRSINIRSDGKVAFNGKTIRGNNIHIKDNRVIIDDTEYTTSGIKRNSITIQGHDLNTLDLEIRTEGPRDDNQVDSDIVIDYHNAYIKTLYKGPSKASRSYILKVPKDIFVKMLRTNEGSITIQNLNGALENIQSTSGDVMVKNINNNVFVQTICGNVSLDSIKGHVHATSVSGTIDMRLGSFKNTTLAASTFSGKCTSRVIINGIRENNTLDGNVGHGGPMKLLKTTSGDIIIKK